MKNMEHVGGILNSHDNYHIPAIDDILPKGPYHRALLAGYPRYEEWQNNYEIPTKSCEEFLYGQEQPVRATLKSNDT